MANFGLDLQNADFKMLAEACGARGHRPTSEASLEQLLAYCLAEHAVHVLDVAIDYSSSQEIQVTGGTGRGVVLVLLSIAKADVSRVHAFLSYWDLCAGAQFEGAPGGDAEVAGGVLAQRRGEQHP